MLSLTSLADGTVAAAVLTCLLATACCAHLAGLPLIFVGPVHAAYAELLSWASAKFSAQKAPVEQISCTVGQAPSSAPSTIPDHESKQPATAEGQSGSQQRSPPASSIAAVSNCVDSLSVPDEPNEQGTSIKAEIATCRSSVSAELQTDADRLDTGGEKDFADEVSVSAATKDERQEELATAGKIAASTSTADVNLENKSSIYNSYTGTHLAQVLATCSVRSKPTKQADKIGEYKPGQIVRVLRTTKTDDGYTMSRVDIPNKPEICGGWVKHHTSRGRRLILHLDDPISSQN